MIKLKSLHPAKEDNALLKLYDKEFECRLLLGTARYPSPESIANAIQQSGVQIVTVSLRRESANAKSGHAFWSIIKDLDVTVLPNTAGCQTATEAIKTAKMAREVFETNWIKLEVTGNENTLQPDPFELTVAAQKLSEDGFQVFPYITEDIVVAEHLVQAGCKVLMPWGAPIGTGRGLNNIYGLTKFRENFPDIPLIIDAGIGTPSHATHAMELGYDAVLINTAVAKAKNPPKMAVAFASAVSAGRLGFESGLIPEFETAQPSTPVFGSPSSPFNG